MAVLDFKKTPSDKNITVRIAPTSGATGILDVDEPTAEELGLMTPASQSISWNDWDFGTQASEVTNEPSLADAASYEEFGAANYGGGMSFLYPLEYDDNSNLHSVIYDMTEDPDVEMDVAVRIDGDTPTTVAFEDGDFISVYRVQANGETTPFTPGEASKRRTINWIPKSDFSHQVVVGEHTITPILPDSFVLGSTGRIRASQQGRDTTNYLTFVSTTPEVVSVYPGGFYEVTGEGVGSITISDPGTGDSVDVPVVTTLS